MSTRGATRKPLRWVAAAVVSVALAAACGSDDDGAVSPPWGEEAVALFEGAYGAFAARDFYGVLDYYAPGAEIDMWRIDFTGGSIVHYLSIEPILARALLDVHLGDAGALALISWPDFSERYGAVEVEVDEGSIVRETVLHDVATLRRSARASPAVAGFYESLFDEYARAWSSGAAGDLARMYAPGATVAETITDLRLEGRDAISRSASDEPADWAPLSLFDIDDGPEAGSGPALFLGRTRFGQDPGIAVGVFRVERADGCAVQRAVRWKFEDGLIVDEVRYPEVEGFRSCSPGELPVGWWTGLGLPGPRDEVVTATIDTADGAIAVHNGTDRLVDLVRWGLSRFAAADLVRPRVETVTFEPSRQCRGVSGRVVDDAASRDLFLCVYDEDLCASARTGSAGRVDDDACRVPVLTARIGLLHELGHAWLLDHVDDRTEDRLLEEAGLVAWDDTSLPWHERGVEYAAEVLAWGLLEERIPMVRIGDPPCRELRARFELLTGFSPPGSECPASA